MSDLSYPKDGGGFCITSIPGLNESMDFPVIGPQGANGVTFFDASVCNPTDDIGYDDTYSFSGSSNLELPLKEGGYCEKTIVGDHSKMARPALMLIDGVLHWVDMICIPNILPLVNAGIDLEMINGGVANITGEASDEDGTIESLLWVQVSGPEETEISNSAQLAMSVSPTTVGTYVYELKATDNKGESKVDTMTLIITPNCCDDLVTHIGTLDDGVFTGVDGTLGAVEL